ncbi:MAG: radical SAM protein [Bacilli bacterium]|nr:radical SAM protein [Bacilli bacterium]
MIENCRLCPRKCGVNRDNGELGFCGVGSEMIISRYSLHMGEEPCISGNGGSGTIFFSHCNMKCVFCQNYEISIDNKGRIVSVEEFCDICMKLQDRGASNINLVTGCMYIPLIVEGLKLAKSKGLDIPIVYNSSGYESVGALRLLDGLVDIYLPDFKYYDDNLAWRYSKAKDYYKYTSLAIEEMYRQVGKFEFDKDGMMLNGVIIRHLVMPSCCSDSMKIIKCLYDKYKDNIYFSIMNQYTPIRKIGVDSLERLVTDDEYDKVIDYAYDLGIRNAFIQECNTQSKDFIPDFDQFDGV